MRGWLQGLGLGLLSLLITLALCEGVLRIFGRELLPEPDLYVEDPDTGKRMRPGWSGDEFGAPVVINSRGLRSPELPYARSAGARDTLRILALGDSWTFGFRMREPDAYPRQLERILNARALERDEPPRFEVINAGVIGYSTDQEAAYLRVEGHRYAPDLVVLAYYPVNDTHRKLHRYQRHRRLREIHPLLLDAYLLPRELYVRQFIKGARRALKRRVGDARVALAETIGVDDPAGRALAENDWTLDYRPDHPGWQSVVESLREIGEIGRARGHAILVVLLPDVEDLGRYIDRYHPKVAPMIGQAVASAGLDFHDLLPAFLPYRDSNAQVRLEGHRHPNAHGYGVIAGAVAREIERRYLGVVELIGIEPTTSALRTQRSPS